LHPIWKLLELRLSLLRSIQQLLGLGRIQFPQDWQQFETAVLLQIIERYPPRSGIEADLFGVRSRLVEYLVNGIQRNRGWEVLPESHKHGREVVASDRHRVLFVITCHGTDEDGLLVSIALTR